MSDKLTLALIGCGGMMGAHVAGYRELYDAKLRDFEIIRGRAEGAADRRAVEDEIEEHDHGNRDSS